MNHTIKIQTLNLWHNPIEYSNRVEKLIQQLHKDKPDVLCLQEVTFPPNEKNTAEFIAAETGLHVVAAHPEHNPNRSDGVETGNAILSSFPVIKHDSHIKGEQAGYRQDFQPAGFIPLYSSNSQTSMNTNAVWAWLKTPNNNDLLIITSHLSWGVFNEYQRLQEVIDINNLASDLTKHNPYALTIFGTSSNATPDSDSMRFLGGKVAIENTKNFWIDVWEHCNSDDESGETQTPRNVWSRVMASENGTLDTNRLPKRRIDYLFARDWIYGQNGSPISSRVAFTEPLSVGIRPDAPISDHYGVEGVFYDYPRK